MKIEKSHENSMKIPSKYWNVPLHMENPMKIGMIECYLHLLTAAPASSEDSAAASAPAAPRPSSRAAARRGPGAEKFLEVRLRQGGATMVYD